MNLLVYYSRSGLTKRIAADYKQKKDTDVLEIKVDKDYKGPIGFIKARIDSINKRLPKLETYDIDLKKYDKVIILGAVWANSICAPVKSFLYENRGKIKNVEYIAISKRRISNFCDIFDGMDYCINAHYKRATAISVKFNRIVNIKRY